MFQEILNNLGISFWQYIWVSIILFGAFLINSIAGFGSGSASMGFLVQIIRYSRAVFIVNLQESIAYFYLVIINKNRFEITKILGLILGVTCGILLGVWVLKEVNINLLEVLLGMLIVFSGMRVLKLKQKKLLVKANFVWDFVIGSLAGLSGSLFNIEGPVLMTYLDRRFSDHQELRIALINILAITGVIKLVIFLFSSLILPELLILALAFVPISFLGAFCGNLLAKFVPPKVYKVIVFVLMLLAGFNLIFRN